MSFAQVWHLPQTRLFATVPTVAVRLPAEAAPITSVKVCVRVCLCDGSASDWTQSSAQTPALSLSLYFLFSLSSFCVNFTPAMGKLHLILPLHCLCAHATSESRYLWKSLCVLNERTHTKLGGHKKICMLALHGIRPWGPNHPAARRHSQHSVLSQTSKVRRWQADSVSSGENRARCFLHIYLS